VVRPLVSPSLTWTEPVGRLPVDETGGSDCGGGGGSVGTAGQAFHCKGGRAGVACPRRGPGLTKGVLGASSSSPRAEKAGWTPGSGWPAVRGFR